MGPPPTAGLIRSFKSRGRAIASSPMTIQKRAIAATHRESKRAVRESEFRLAVASLREQHHASVLEDISQCRRCDEAERKRAVASLVHSPRREATKRAKCATRPAAANLDPCPSLEQSLHRMNTLVSRGTAASDVLVVSDRVYCADAIHGVAEIEGANGNIAGWRALILDLQFQFLNSKTLDHMPTGEYNMVVESAAKFSTAMPQLVNHQGRALQSAEFVVRLTRPDMTQRPNGTGCYRYRCLDDAKIEIAAALAAASSGFGLPVHAAFAFPGPIVRRQGQITKLYGVGMVMPKASDHFGGFLGAQSSTGGIRRCGHQLLDALMVQAKTGTVHFDSKPSNYLVRGNSVFLTDFDSAMYGWKFISSQKESLLVGLAMLSAHIRGWCPPKVADEWAAFVRVLLQDLCTAMPRESWTMRATTKPCTSYRPCQPTCAEDSRDVLESIAGCYFLSPDRYDGMTTVPRLVIGAPLVPQLVKFALR